MTRDRYRYTSKDLVDSFPNAQVMRVFYFDLHLYPKVNGEIMFDNGMED
jgi:hypothetical protein